MNALRCKMFTTVTEVTERKLTHKNKLGMQTHVQPTMPGRIIIVSSISGMDLTSAIHANFDFTNTAYISVFSLKTLLEERLILNVRFFVLCLNFFLV